MKKRLLALILALSLLLTGCAELDSILSGLLPTVPPVYTGEDTTVSDGHTDTDDDGFCDDCGTNVVIIIDFYAINDLHGKFNDVYNVEGIDNLTGYLKGEMAQDYNSVLLSSGDMWQGSAHSNLTRGNIITDWMNHMGFVSMTMGNHEYDWGKEPILSNADMAEFPFLGINIFDSETEQRIDYCEASVVIERKGLRIGIIGAIGDCMSDIASDMRGGYYFKTGFALTSLIKAESERLREEEGVDFVVLSLHDGYGKSKSTPGVITDKNLRSYYDIALSDGYIDLVFEGHTHQSYVLYDSEGVYHVQGGGDNSGLSHVEVEINFANGSHNVSEAEVVRKNDFRNSPSDSIASKLLAKYDKEIGWVDEPLGRVSSSIFSDDLCDLVAKLYYQKGIEVWGDEYDIVLGGAYLSTRSPYDLQWGEVTYSQLTPLLPFDNGLVLCSIKGSDLMRVFFNSSNSKYHMYYEEYGADIGANIDYNKTYYIITDTYTSTYSYNNITEIERLDENIYARDLLAEYIKEGGLE